MTTKTTNFEYKFMEIEFGIEICVSVRIRILATISMESGDDFGSKKLIKSRFESDLERI